MSKVAGVAGPARGNRNTPESLVARIKANGSSASPYEAISHNGAVWFAVDMSDGDGGTTHLIMTTNRQACLFARSILTKDEHASDHIDTDSQDDKRSPSAGEMIASRVNTALCSVARCLQAKLPF